MVLFIPDLVLDVPAPSLCLTCIARQQHNRRSTHNGHPVSFSWPSRQAVHGLFSSRRVYEVWPPQVALSRM